ncbi:hypothetical protein B6D60_06980 [candidate division KSB1 bacterium 4484_87]|nr:MAG: hypothetical protein B6D60_06980 [candidate division KSB1 bacterium 4484_87]
MWQIVLQFTRQSQRIFLALIFVLAAEVAFSGVLTWIFPETWYLRSFLSWELMQRTRDFLAGRFEIVADEKLGWRNQPGYIGEKIQFDEFGARAEIRTTPQNRRKNRVILLGDSRINGGDKISAENTISGFLKDKNIETLNFGTPYFSLDQIYLSLMEKTKQFSPDIVVVGLSGENTKLLDCLYLPFCDTGVKFALVKPRFVLKKEHLILIQPNILEFLEDIPASIEPLAFFHRYDDHYQKFEKFKKQQFTPLLGLIHLLKMRFEKQGDATYQGNSLHQKTSLANKELANALLQSMQIYAHEWNFRIILLLLPEKYEFEIATDNSAYSELRELAQLNQFNFIDGLKILQKEGISSLSSDGFYFTPEANRIIADSLKKFCKPELTAKSGLH